MIDWFQFVLFAEVGPVAERYDLSLLMTELKYDVDFSVHTLATKILVRFEMAYGRKGVQCGLCCNNLFNTFITI